mgnify:CR=1 FL=1
MKENKLIAEFMGSEWHKAWFKDVCIISPSNISYKFHSSWDWLMPVVERIRGLEEGMLVERIDIMPNDGVAIHYSHPPKMIVVDTSKRVNTLNATYQAVVEFIKQLNKES